MNERTKERIKGRMNKRTNEKTKGWIKRRMNERMNESGMKESINFQGQIYE